MKTNHTPGPWFAVEYAGIWNIQSGEFYGDDDLLNSDHFDEIQAEANAKLAAAAPELLEACMATKAMYEAQGITEESRIGGEQYSSLLKAIKKATE